MDTVTCVLVILGVATYVGIVWGISSYLAEEVEDAAAHARAGGGVAGDPEGRPGPTAGQGDTQGRS